MTPGATFRIRSALGRGVICGVLPAEGEAGEPLSFQRSLQPVHVQVKRRPEAPEHIRRRNEQARRRREERLALELRQEAQVRELARAIEEAG